MKKIFIALIGLFLLGQDISFAADSVTPETTSEIQGEVQTRTPDFSPPKDLSGPVFPPEEFIQEPNQDTNRFLNEFVSMLATLGLIISLILIVAYFLKRMLNSRQEQANVTSLIKVIERRSLSPKTAIYLLEIEGKSLLIAETHNGVTRLADYDSPKDIEEPKPLPSAFSKMLDTKREEI